MNINAGDDAGGTIGQISGSLTNTRLALYSGTTSGNDNLSACGSGSEQVSGLIDMAGYTPGSGSCGDNILRLDTTNPDEWHQAHHLFCSYNDDSPQISCHYPHEQLQTIMPAGNDTVLIISRQRYPFNPEADGIGPVRISKLWLSGRALTADGTFGRNGTQVLSPSSSNRINLPADTLPAGQLLDQDSLTALYPAGQSGALLVRFPFGEPSYITAPLPLPGQPVLMAAGDQPDHYTVWMRDQGNGNDVLRSYQVWVSFLKPEYINGSEFSLEDSGFPYAPVIGLGTDDQWLYIARQDDQDIVLERIALDTAQRDTWQVILENIQVAAAVSFGSGLAYHLLPRGHRMDLVPLHSFVTVNPHRAWRIDLPQYGGYAEWSESELAPLSVTTNFITTDPATTDQPGSGISNLEDR